MLQTGSLNTLATPPYHSRPLPECDSLVGAPRLPPKLAISPGPREATTRRHGPHCLTRDCAASAPFNYT